MIIWFLLWYSNSPVSFANRTPSIFEEYFWGMLGIIEMFLEGILIINLASKYLLAN
jgi:hypothetical protein